MKPYANRKLDLTTCDEGQDVCWHNHTILHAREEPCESNFVCSYPEADWSHVCGEYGIAVGVGNRDSVWWHSF